MKSNLRIQINNHTYRFHRLITHDEHTLFQTHRGADRYYFKKSRGGGGYLFYLRTNTHMDAPSKYHPANRKISNKSTLPTTIV